MSDLDAIIRKYLIPDMAIGKNNKETIYKNFYHDNLTNGKSLINDISVVITNIKQYLSLRHEETAAEFDTKDE